MNKLEEICHNRKIHVEKNKRILPLKEIEQIIASLPHQSNNFAKAISKKSARSGNTAIIAETKRKSPSEGNVNTLLSPADTAKIYQQAGACCISVLTEPDYFSGKDQDIQDVKKSCDLPILRKDFIVDIYQIFESKMLGSDCILLIISALDHKAAKDMHNCAVNLGLDVIVEIHDRNELEIAMELSPKMIGINNRNLKTLETDINISADLAPLIPDDIIKISESGISSPQQIEFLKNKGFQSFLIGHGILKNKNTPEEIIASLKSFSRVR